MLGLAKRKDIDMHLYTCCWINTCHLLTYHVIAWQASLTAPFTGHLLRESITAVALPQNLLACSVQGEIGQQTWRVHFCVFYLYIVSIKFARNSNHAGTMKVHTCTETLVSLYFQVFTSLVMLIFTGTWRMLLTTVSFPVYTYLTAHGRIALNFDTLAHVYFS